MKIIECLDRFSPTYNYEELRDKDILHNYYYFTDNDGRARDRRYPRLSKKIEFQVWGMTDSGRVVPVRARRTLALDLDFGEFCEKVKTVILEKGGGVSKLEALRISGKMMSELSTGHMYSAVGTNPQLKVESGTLGVVTDLDPDYYPARMVVFWPNLGIEGYWAHIPCVSRQPGKEYDLEILFDESPADLGITDEMIRQQKRDFDEAFQKFFRRPTSSV
jgi:hypothetical protein